MTLPLVSIIVPIYNTEKYLTKCLESIISQTYNNLEIILINDGSEDNSNKIIENYKKYDSRIISIQQQNKGQGYSRNFGIKLSKGEFIMFIDSDDFIEVNTIETLIYLRQKADVIVYGVNRIDENKFFIDLKYNNKLFTGNQAYNSLLNNFLFNFSPCNKFYKTTLIKNNSIFFPENRGMEDYLFILKIFFYSKEVYTVDNQFYNYLNRIGSTSKTFDIKKIDNTLSVINSIEKFVLQIEDSNNKSLYLNLYFSLIFDTLSGLLRFSNKSELNINLSIFYNKLRKENYFKIENILKINKINMLRLIKFKFYELKNLFQNL